MKKLLKDNWIPVATSVAALVLATIVGLIPIFRSEGDRPAESQAGVEQRLTALEAKIETLVSSPTQPMVNQGTGIDPALRAELDQIVKGLVNQTGRISRLKKDVGPMLAWADSPPVPDRVEQQIKLINQALLNQTARIRLLKADVAPVAENKSDIDRLTLQVKNLESAVKQLHKRLVKVSAQLEAATATSSGDADESTLKSIETKLEAMLKTLKDQ